MKDRDMNRHFKYQREFQFLDRKYQVSFFGGPNVFEIRVMTRTNWWKRNVRGVEWEWKRIYFGHNTPINEAVKIYDEGLKAYQKELDEG